VNRVVELAAMQAFTLAFRGTCRRTLSERVEKTGAALANAGSVSAGPARGPLELDVLVSDCHASTLTTLIAFCIRIGEDKPLLADGHAGDDVVAVPVRGGAEPRASTVTLADSSAEVLHFDSPSTSPTASEVS